LKRIAKASRERVLAEHTSASRARELEILLESSSSSPATNETSAAVMEA
jgi:hypothetical protein